MFSSAQACPFQANPTKCKTLLIWTIQDETSMSALCHQIVKNCFHYFEITFSRSLIMCMLLHDFVDGQNGGGAK